MGKCIIILVCISVCMINSIGCSLTNRQLNRKIKVVRNGLEKRLVSALADIDDLRDNMGTCKCTDANSTVTVHGGWASWSLWASCSATCGMGLQRRDRSCSNPYPGPDGNPCFGDYGDARACFDGACADGSWSVWSSWGACSASCRGGLSRKMRTCTNPSPSKFGHDCIGNSDETKICNTHYCQDVRNGGWSVWSSWSDCSAGCNGGEQTRQRSCTDPLPSTFGHACSGSDWQTKLCNVKNCNQFASMRLVGGTSRQNGRLELNMNGQWGTVCDDHFSNLAAKVVCEMLTYPSTNATQHQEAHYGQGTGPIWMDDVTCTGTELSLLDCKHIFGGPSYPHCTHNEDVGVSCD